MKSRFVSLTPLLVGALSLGINAHADIVFSTLSTATQTLSSPAFGGAVPITSRGIQVFTFNVATNLANVTSAFQGNDLPDPAGSGQKVTYDLYNTATTGTITQNASGKFDIAFSLLFELKVTSGLAAGLTFETKTISHFNATNVIDLPFKLPVAFTDPGPNSDTVPILIKFDPSGQTPVGTVVGTSSGRTVTTPEPASMILSAIGMIGLTAMMYRRNRAA